MAKYLILGAAIVVAGALIGGRYNIVATAQGTGAFKIDRFTGKTWLCTTLACRPPSENNE